MRQHIRASLTTALYSDLITWWKIGMPSIPRFDLYMLTSIYDFSFSFRFRTWLGWFDEWCCYNRISDSPWTHTMELHTQTSLATAGTHNKWNVNAHNSAYESSMALIPYTMLLSWERWNHSLCVHQIISRARKGSLWCCRHSWEEHRIGPGGQKLKKRQEFLIYFVQWAW